MDSTKNKEENLTNAEQFIKLHKLMHNRCQIPLSFLTKCLEKHENDLIVASKKCRTQWLTYHTCLSRPIDYYHSGP